MSKVETKNEKETETVKTDPIVKPQAVTVHEMGFCYKTLVVNMTEDITLDDVGNHPEIWKPVQVDRAAGKALCEDDKVEMRWLDKRVYAVVDYADSEGVTFADIRKVTKRTRDREPFNDGTYAVRWTPGGWTYFRVHDGVRMSTATWSTWQACRIALFQEQYPRKVA